MSSCGRVAPRSMKLPLYISCRDTSLYCTPGMVRCTLCHVCMSSDFWRYAWSALRCCSACGILLWVLTWRLGAPGGWACTPSICVRISALTRRLASCSPAAPRAEQSASISSMKIVLGAIERASSNRQRTIRSLSPLRAHPKCAGRVRAASGAEHIDLVDEDRAGRHRAPARTGSAPSARSCPCMWRKHADPGVV